jgi:hypothetical protein
MTWVTRVKPDKSYQNRLNCPFNVSVFLSLVHYTEVTPTFGVKLKRIRALLHGETKSMSLLPKWLEALRTVSVFLVREFHC